MIAVRHVEPGEVHSGLRQTSKCIPGARLGTDRADDLGEPCL
jgi:hypothetical protein